jgi:hypothetical protein
MTIQSWNRGRTLGSSTTLKKSRPSATCTRDNRYRPSVERLEDRTLMSSSGLGLGFAHTLGSAGSENGLDRDAEWAGRADAFLV